MLRAIELMGWPLDMICSVDIWFDETTPAELPPMVAFKDEYDLKVLNWFGIPVTRLCATKRERERERERAEGANPNQTESATHDGLHTAMCSTPNQKPKSTDGTSTDSHAQDSDGASDSRTPQTRTTVTTSKLTYKDIFYRKVSPQRERERERESGTDVPGQARRTARTHSAWENWPNEPGVGRVVDGIPNRMDRVKCLGNAVVPQQFFPFFDAIYKISYAEKE